ncbi:MAG: hypothetical protein ACRDPR_02565, partial [Nocardioidaceae bacterium]
MVCSGANWVNGNLNPNNSHYREGDSVPFRMRMTGFTTTGPHTLVIEYDNTRSNGAHAYDYLTSYNRTETSADPCSGVAGCVLVGATYFPIPTDPSLANASPPVTPVAQAQRQFAIWNGVITSATYTSGPAAGGNGGSPEGTSLSTRVTITFTSTPGANVVLAWGGHIASYIDWGEGDSAAGISGSPYHMRLISLNGGGGNQDRSISGSAVPEAPLPITTQASVSSINLLEGSVTDTATFTPNTGSPNPSGTARFYICGPTTTSPPNCTSGGVQVGNDITFTNQTTATSDPFTPVLVGLYCFRLEYLPAASSPYSPGLHTNQSLTPPNNECFEVAANHVDLSITKSDGVTSVTAGDGVTYTYTITVSNAGPSAAQGVVVSDTWPAEFSRGTITNAHGTCVDTGGGPSFSCNLGTIASGGSKSFTVTYTVPATTEAGSVTNTASVSTTTNEPNTTNNSASDTNTVVESVDLDVVKDFAGDEPETVTAGTTGNTFTITVTNNGPSNADGVEVTDTVDARLQVTGVATDTGTCAPAAQTI